MKITQHSSLIYQNNQAPRNTAQSGFQARNSLRGLNLSGAGTGHGTMWQQQFSSYPNSLPKLGIAVDLDGDRRQDGLLSIDFDGDGRHSDKEIAELHRILAHPFGYGNHSAMTKEDIERNTSTQRAFKALDQDGNGIVNAQELKKAGAKVRTNQIIRDPKADVGTTRLIREIDDGRPAQITKGWSPQRPYPSIQTMMMQMMQMMMRLTGAQHYGARR